MLKTKSLTYAFVFLFSLLSISTFSFNASAQSQPSPSSLPWRSTPEEQAEWRKLEEVLRILSTKYYRELTAKEVVQYLLNGMETIDPHTGINSPEETDEQNVQIQGSFGGLGLEIQKKNDGVQGILVISPIDDTPASLAGILPGDIIVKIDNTLTADLPVSEAMSLMRGAPGTMVTIVIYREGLDAPLSFTLTRAIIKIRFVKYELKDGGIGYIRITSFEKKTIAKDVYDAYVALVERNDGKKLTGLVLDLAKNPGGLLDSALLVSDLFIDENSYLDPSGRINPSRATIVSKEHRRVITPVYEVNRFGDITKGTPLLVLVDRGSASASEIVAGVLQITGRAIIAGEESTFGKGTIQIITPLRTTGGSMRVTIGQYLIGPKHCEKAVQGIGITPDIFLKKEGATSVMLDTRESDLRNRIETLVPSHEHCTYEKPEITREDREMAIRMLRALELTPLITHHE